MKTINQSDSAKRTKSKTNNPSRLKIILTFLKELGKIAKRIWDPSKGGMGNKLKTANNIFKKTM